MAFLRIIAMRPNSPISGDARGGLGGTSGCRTIGMSRASAMLTMASRLNVGTAAGTHIVRNYATIRGVRVKTLVSQLSDRNPVLRCRPGAGDDTLLIEQRHHGTT